MKKYNKNINKSIKLYITIAFNTYIMNKKKELSISKIY